MLTLANTKESSIQLNRDAPNWLPAQFIGNYNETDLTYDFCLKLFVQLEAAKRDDIPETTMRQWFLEFVRLNWTEKMVETRYKALIKAKKYGAIDFNDWVESVEVFGLDEVNLMVKQRIESLIQRGNYLKDKKIELTVKDKKAIDLAEAKQAEFYYKRNLADKTQTYREERRERYNSKLEHTKLT